MILQVLGIIIPIILEIVIPCFIIFKIYCNFDAILYYTKFLIYSVGITCVATILLPYFLLHPRDVHNVV
jgi:hypothetical protein